MAQRIIDLSLTIEDTCQRTSCFSVLSLRCT